ncbi:MAG: response regulator transcription factor [Starkeya sp.]|nr:response regulator transcription factor [Starkeya sp.]
MSEVPMIAIVDDDESVRVATSSLVRSFGFKTTVFASAEDFLASPTMPRTACLVTDVQMPTMSGIELFEALRARGVGLPVIFITSFPEERVKRRAQEAGAAGFLAKPFDADTVLERVRDAIAAHGRRASAEPGDLLTAHFPGHDLLTPREREVLVQIASGASNKEAGRTLGISPRTIEVHRARIMEKLGAKNAADLVRIVLKDMRD